MKCGHNFDGRPLSCTKCGAAPRVEWVDERTLSLEDGVYTFSSLVDAVGDVCGATIVGGGSD